MRDVRTDTVPHAVAAEILRHLKGMRAGVNTHWTQDLLDRIDDAIAAAETALREP